MINQIKQKLETKFNKKFFIKNGNILTDENNTFKWVFNADGSVDVNQRHYNDIFDLIADIAKIEENIELECDLFNLDKRFAGDWEEKQELIKDATEQNRIDWIERLINDRDFYVRCEVVKAAVKLNRIDWLEKLINDRDYYVRYKIVKAAVKLNRIDWLEKLIDDQDYAVRCEVVKAAVKLNRIDWLEKLIDDQDYAVRCEVVKAAVKLNRIDLLEKLINDQNYYVRCIVAKAGYGLNALYKSNGNGSSYIKNECKHWLKANGCKNIREYCKKFQDLVYNGEYKYM